jgi:acetyltransferase-like isoleucine patch superfamily enzyme
MIKFIVYIFEGAKYLYGRLFVKNLICRLGKYEYSDISYPISVKSPENLYIGKNVKIGPMCIFGAFEKISIGEGSRISSNCIIETASLDLSKLHFGSHRGKEIFIGKNVWIGTGSVILGGTSIGDNSFISAGSIVSVSIPADSIYKNNIIKTRNYEKVGI